MMRFVELQYNLQHSAFLGKANITLRLGTAYNFELFWSRFQIMATHSDSLKI